MNISIPLEVAVCITIWLVYAVIISILYALRHKLEFKTSLVLMHVVMFLLVATSDIAQAILFVAFIPLLQLMSGTFPHSRGYGNSFIDPTLSPLIPLILGIGIGYIIGRYRPTPKPS